MVLAGNESPSGWWVAAPIIIAVAAVVFTIASFWWLNVAKGRLRVVAPHQAGIFPGKALFRLRLPLLLQNTGARTFVVSDMECWFPDTEQALPLSWGMTCKSLRSEAAYTEDAPVRLVVPSRQTVSAIVEFRAPLPGFEIDAGTHGVLVRGLVDGQFRDLLRLTVPVSPPMLKLDRYQIVHLAGDEYGQERANQAARRLLDRLRSGTTKPPDAGSDVDSGSA